MLSLRWLFVPWLLVLCPEPSPLPPGLPAPEPSTARVGGPTLDDGTEIDLDLPTRLHVRNRGGSDGAGLCVFASMRHSGLWADEPVFAAMFEWMFTRPGGGYPEKVDRMINRYCTVEGKPVPPYVQIEGSDLEPLRRAVRAGLMPGVTYYRSPTGRYGGRRIPHMVSLVAAGEKWWAILDNNFPGTIEWMSQEEFLRSYTDGSGKGWAIIPLTPGPPPLPRNRS
jgi:hypothetical protein